MIEIKNIEITNEVSYQIITIPYDKDCPLLNVNFDIDSEVVVVDGKRYVVNDVLISDNGEWINIITDSEPIEVEENSTTN